MNFILTILMTGGLIAAIVFIFYLLPEIILTTSKNKQLVHGVKVFYYTIALLGFGIFMLGAGIAINYFMNQ